MTRRRSWALWIAWLTAVWLLAIFLASIVAYSRGIDVVALLAVFVGQLVVTIAWTLYRPLPLWIVYFYGLIVLSGVVGLLITIPGGLVVSWLEVGIVPAGLAMLVAGVLARPPSEALAH